MVTVRSAAAKERAQTQDTGEEKQTPVQGAKQSTKGGSKP